ncbi:ribosome recycling factor family protein [Vibrio coralliilyticus]|uniref:ribosome recycling factor family protein n=1 Tax=Vibrio TaxID=662 RepID=UPI0006CCBCB3|nr:MULTISPECIES: ribosome recycling factor family protein [Vibrio]AXN30729.1 ribosome recycling factor [Vibrio coralliilyticus]KPH27110.1 ribosome recycling factor [Vibrio coralliilyticus]MCC2523798.1 ribosome recycling factor family protein [Vibrio coralliilyticus]NOH55845.1 ribosome recycling factor [Vibrio coralliilyticus]NOI29239.1 ribosome recycling factor [Vibrio coralliilyticus]
MPSENLVVSLPSLIHRIGGDANKQLRIVAKQHDCELKRVRRSRNWQLIGQPEALLDLFNNLSEQSTEFDFVLSKLNVQISQSVKPRESTEERLKRILLADPTITLTELMERTGCSLSEARTARFESEIL